jgi:hypothetical protein
MPSPQPHWHWRPTGEFRFITGWFGILRVQREESRYTMSSPEIARPQAMVLETRWRRAPSGVGVTQP